MIDVVVNRMVVSSSWSFGGLRTSSILHVAVSRMLDRVVKTVPAVLLGLAGWIGALALAEEPPQGAVPDPAMVAKTLDALLAEELASPGYQAAPPAEDAVYLRRVFLDLVGEPPTVDDVLAFLTDGSANKKARIVETLLADAKFGENWAHYWRDVILARRSDERALLVSGPFVQFMSEALNANRPWDQIVTEIITAQGDVLENGATALIMAQQGRPEEIVSEVSRIFMGIQIQCAQCHNHPTERWEREQFHQLAAFFPRVAVRPDRSKERPTFLVTVNDSPFIRPRAQMANRFVGTPEHYMPDLSNPEARGTLMRPVFFVTGQSLPVGVPDARRRGALAQWLTAPENPWFSRAFVNRMWAELCGEGFYEPVDQLGPDHTPTAPRALDYLAEQFVRSKYDIKWLFRVITATDLYQRQGRARRNPEQPPMQANVVQPLRSDVLYNCVTAALGVESFPGDRGARFGLAGRFGPRGRFAQVFGYDPSVPRSDVVTTVPQALLLMNSPMLVNALAQGPALRAALLDYPRNADAISYLYLRTLSRLPTEEELSWAERQVARAENRRSGLEDLLWALINSAEFRHRP
jgi:hypothetical protein